MFADLRAQAIFIGAVVKGFAAALRRPRLMRWQEVGVVFEKAGVNALPIVSLISLLMGLVIAFEAAQPLEMFGAQIFIADMIGLVMVREFSPIFTAIILAGRSGAAFAAEIGTMKVNEELEPSRRWASIPSASSSSSASSRPPLLMPVLTAYSMLVGVFGGVLVMLTMGFPVAQIWAQLSAPWACTTCSWARASRSCSARSSPDSGACGACRRRKGPTPWAIRRPGPSSPGSS